MEELIREETTGTIDGLDFDEIEMQNINAKGPEGLEQVQQLSEDQKNMESVQEQMNHLKLFSCYVSVQRKLSQHE